MAMIKQRSNNQWRIVSGVPRTTALDAPTRVRLSSPTSGVLRVVWTGNDTLSPHIIAIRQVGQEAVLAMAMAGPDDTDCLVPGLTPGLSYVATVAVEAPTGQGSESLPSASCTVTGTQSYTLPNGLVIPAGWPNPVTTGVLGVRKQYGELTYHAGDITTTADNQIIQNLDIRGRIIVRHQQVTIRHCRVRATSTATLLAGDQAIIDARQFVLADGRQRWLADSLTVSYCDVIGVTDAQSYNQTGIASGGSCRIAIDHCLVHSTTTALLPGSESATTSNCVYDMRTSEGPGDCYRLTAGRNIVCEDNAFMGQSMATAIQLGSQTGPLTNVVINHNFISGGPHPVSVDDSGEGANGPITAEFTNNVFSGIDRGAAPMPLGGGMSFANSNRGEHYEQFNSW